MFRPRRPKSGPRGRGLVRNGVTVRPAGRADRAACAAIFLERRKERFHWLDPDSLRPEDFAASVRGEEIWVAEAHGEVVGFSSMYVAVSFVHNLFVRADWEGRGVGRLLMDHAVARLNWPVTLKCVTANAPARAFYDRLGFTEQRRGFSDNGVEYVLYMAPMPATPLSGAPLPGGRRSDA